MSKGVVSLNEDQLINAEFELSSIKGGAPKAMSRAINRSLQSARGSMVKSVRDEYTAKAAAIRSTLSITKASPARLEATIKSVGSPLPLRDFNVSPKTANAKRRTPIRVSVRKGNKSSLNRSFVVRTGGKVNVFERVGGKRLPIKKLFGPSVPQMIGNDKVIDLITEQTKLTMDKRLEHEINHLLGGGR